MNEKRSAIITITILSAIILIFTAADLIQKDRLYSEKENRLLAAKPEFTWEAFAKGDYTEAYEAYATDQFVGRDRWIRIHTWLELCLQKEEIGGVYLGADGYLIEQHLPEEFPEELVEEKAALLEKLVKRWNAQVMLVPTADNILTDKLPAWAIYYDQKALLDRVAEVVGSKKCIDVYSMLSRHAKEEIYYRTDHHWTSLGAYYGYQAWAEAKGLDIVWNPEDLELAAEGFLGTLYSKVNIPMRSDVIQFFPGASDPPLTVTYDLREKKNTCYEKDYLETKNKYGFFLDDNHAFVEIDTGCHNGKTLFVIKDSYANCFVPMLIPHYEKIYMMDLRYYNGRLFRFMEDYEPEGGMEVLVLYNCAHFLEDFSYLE